MDYGKTLNLPQTDFSMRANLPEKEPGILEKWEKGGLYHKLMEHNKEKPLYVLHDGPPYANGDIHLGHTLNKVIKDIVVRHKNMSGYRSPYVPGWDTHGLPIEKQAIKKLGISRHEAGPVKFRQVCKEFALQYVDNQRGQFKRLGVIGEWENPYLTLAPEFEAKQIELFGTMAKKGFIYKGLKPVYWCADCETALAEAEIEYQEDNTASIFVKFPIKDDKGLFQNIQEKVYVVIWTTTTWTLPGNTAISLNPDFEYSLVKSGEEAYIMASELVDNVFQTAGIQNDGVLATHKGSELEYILCSHPFLSRDSVVIVGDHVTLEAGTGCVHTAPGHGMEDYVACKNYKDIPIIVPVDDKGMLTHEAGEFEGLFYAKSNEKIVERLKKDNLLLAISHFDHQYPHCWRCKEPIIYRATEQWFASIDGFKKEALKAIEQVQWIPSWGEERISGMVRDRADWCISRQRTWGVPIPIFYCNSCGKELITDESIQSVADIFKKEGSDAWFIRPASELLPKGTACSCSCTEFTKETDIMDVWFDSGSSFGAVLQARENLHYPADLYLEGNDQYRGWFQSSLLISVANLGIAPYKAVLTHGFVIDDERKKMSKSAGNGIDPLDIIEKFGADILRMWVASSDYKVDVKISNDLIRQLSEGYRKIRNTCRYIIGNISDFSPDEHMVQYKEMEEMDKWALLKFNQLTQKVNAAYERFEYHTLYHAIHNFCVVEMSSFYLDIIKDRLYTEKADSKMRRSGQSAMYIILDGLVRMLSPIISYTAEEIWSIMPHRAGDILESVIFNEMPKYIEEYEDKHLGIKYDKLLLIRADASKALESARADKTIGHSLGAAVEIVADGEDYAFLESVKSILSTVLIVSTVTLSCGKAPEGAYGGTEYKGAAYVVSQAEGEKCERCWIYSTTVGEDADHPTLCTRCAGVVHSL